MSHHELAEPALASGTRLGPYVVESFLGAGGMGQVYRATDDRLQRSVAVKLLPDEFSRDSERLKRFEQEARLAASLNHPNVLGIYDVGRYHESRFIVTELLVGDTLRERLRGRYLVPARALEIAQQLTDGLAAAHERGIIHRDIKPSNIFLCDSGLVKILDFGVAKLLHRDPRTGDPTSGWTTEAVPGTIGYLAPEQAHGRPVDHRADIFSFGCVLFEMLSGRKAFPGATPAEILVATLSSDPPDLASVTSDVPPALSRVVRCCLSKEPDRRYSTVHDLRLALDAAGEQLTRGVWLPRLRVRRVARRMARVMLAGAAVAAVSLGGWSLMRPRSLPTFQERQVTSGTGLEGQPTLSPDGSFVAYSRVEAGNSDVWIVDLQGGAELRLTTHEAWDESPSWYPDSGTLAFVSDRGGQPAIWNVSRLGGNPRMIVPNAQDPAVSPDGRHLAFTRPDKKGNRKLAVAALDRLDEVRFLSQGGLWNDERPAWSPDGRTICYADFNHLWLVDVDGGVARRLTAEGEIELDPAWSPDGRYLYLSAYRGTERGIWRRALAGGPPEPVERGAGQARWPSISRDGRRLAFSSLGVQQSLAIVETATGRQARFEETRQTLTPTLAPDGSEVVFVSTRDSAVDLWRLPLGSDPLIGPPRRITDQPGRAGWPHYSPDGRWIAFQVTSAGQRDIWTMPAAGGPTHRFTEDPAEDTTPAWSPDASQLAFVSDRSGEEEVWVASAREGRRASEPRRLTPGGVSLAWSPDGRRLAYLGLGDGKEDVWVIPVDGSGAPERLTDGADASVIRWAAQDGGLLVLGEWGGRTTQIRRVNPVTLDVAPVPQAEVCGPYTQIEAFDVTPDGRWLTLLEERTHGDIWILEAQEDSF